MVVSRLLESEVCKNGRSGDKGVSRTRKLDINARQTLETPFPGFNKK